MADDVPEVEYVRGPELLQMEASEGFFLCQAPEKPDGKRYLFFGGAELPSLSQVLFGLCLKPETTQREAEALAEHINKHCLAMYGMFYNRDLTDL